MGEGMGEGMGEETMDTKVKILTVCRTNQCRSVMMQGFLQLYLPEDRYIVKSAGTHVSNGHDLTNYPRVPSTKALLALEKWGVDMTHHIPTQYGYIGEAVLGERVPYINRTELFDYVVCANSQTLWWVLGGQSTFYNTALVTQLEDALIGKWNIPELNRFNDQRMYDLMAEAVEAACLRMANKLTSGEVLTEHWRDAASKLKT